MPGRRGVSLRREGEEIAAIMREGTVAGESAPLEDLAQQFGVDPDGRFEQ